MEPQPDPCQDRKVTTVEPPPARPLSFELLRPNGPGTPPNWEVLRDHLEREGLLLKEHVLDIVAGTKSLLQGEGTLLHLKDPITVAGDIHGQYYDLLKLLQVGGRPGETQYLFLGDYVDRGSFSVEVLLLVFSLKLCYPDKIWMLRGNHECRQMTSYFNFRDECEYKYDIAVYDAFMDCFDCLPLGATINGKLLAIHGGLSPILKTLQDIQGIQRMRETPRVGLYCDLLWADPEKDGPPQTEAFVRNKVRGCSWFFSMAAAREFLVANDLVSLIRAHEAQPEGFKMHEATSDMDFPTVTTIFSAPNYCDVYNNMGAILKVENQTFNVCQFNYTEHPYHLPNFMDVFSWSIPFVAEKVIDILYHVMHMDGDSETADSAIDEVELPPQVMAMVRGSMGEPDPERAAALAAAIQKEMGDGSESHVISKSKADRLRQKILVVGKMQRMYKGMALKNHELVLNDGVASGLVMPKSVRGLGQDRFEAAKTLDERNERMPEGMAE